MFRCPSLVFLAFAKPGRCFSTISGMDLHVVVSALDTIAPVKLAEKWDNVGLLVEPSAPHVVNRVLLTNDLTEDILDEAVKADANMIVSYHPPLFRSFKRLTSKSWKERIAIKAIENRIAIYSPHTAADCVQSGVNDWLAKGLGEHSRTQPITQSKDTSVGALVACNFDGRGEMKPLAGQFDSVKPVTLSGNSDMFICKKGSHNALVQDLQQKGINNSEILVLPSDGAVILNTGAGRLCTLTIPTSLSTIVQRVKKHLKLKHVRLALGRGKTLDDTIKNIAVMAGSGATVLSRCTADLYLTGEMSHHEVLDATQAGINVILCEHSNTERGYLLLLKEKLHQILKCHNDSIIVSKIDRDPLEIV